MGGVRSNTQTPSTLSPALFCRMPYAVTTCRLVQRQCISTYTWQLLARTSVACPGVARRMRSVTWSTRGSPLGRGTVVTGSSGESLTSCICGACLTGLSWGDVRSRCEASFSFLVCGWTAGSCLTPADAYLAACCAFSCTSATVNRIISALCTVCQSLLKAILVFVHPDAVYRTIIRKEQVQCAAVHGYAEAAVTLLVN
jgi:hypothetical protein